MFGYQVLPIIWLDNLTEEVLHDISVTFPGDTATLPSIKKLKPQERKAISLYNLKLSEDKRPLYLEYYNRKLKIMEKDEIFSEFNCHYKGSILIKIQARKKDGRFEYDITKDYT